MTRGDPLVVKLQTCKRNRVFPYAFIRRLRSSYRPFVRVKWKYADRFTLLVLVQRLAYTLYTNGRRAGNTETARKIHREKVSERSYLCPSCLSKEKKIRAWTCHKEPWITRPRVLLKRPEIGLAGIVAYLIEARNCPPRTTACSIA